MELLTPLNEYYAEHPPTEKDILRLGIDICRALEMCAKNKIIHRDVKPSNIFISPNGDYKLGDFGVARRIEATCGAFSKKGTYDYMAPEVYRDAIYDTRADLFSLGIVLYKLMNSGRIPFLPPAPAKISYTDTENAISRRMKNEPLTPPQNASPAFAQVILKACQSDADARFESASQMREALEAIVRSQSEPKEKKAVKAKVTDIRIAPNLAADAKDATEETVLLDTATPPYSSESSEETVLLEEGSASIRPTPSVSQAKPKKPAKAKKESKKAKSKGGNASAPSRTSTKKKKRIVLAAVFAAIVLAGASAVILLTRKDSLPVFTENTSDGTWKVKEYEETYPFYAILEKLDADGNPTGKTTVSTSITKYGAYAELYLKQNAKTGELTHILYVLGNPKDYTEPVEKMGEEEWLIEAYDTNFAEYARKYVNGEPTEETKLTGRILKHEYYYRYLSDGNLYTYLYVDGMPADIWAAEQIPDDAWFLYDWYYNPETFEEYAIHLINGEPDYNDYKTTGRILETFWYTFKEPETESYYRVLYVDGHRSTTKTEPFDTLAADEWVVSGFNAADYREYADHYVDGVANGESVYTGETVALEEWREETEGSYRQERKYINGQPTSETRNRTLIDGSDSHNFEKHPVSTPTPNPSDTNTNENIYIHPAFSNTNSTPAPEPTPTPAPAPTPTPAPAPAPAPSSFDETVVSKRRETLEDGSRLMNYYNAAGELVKQERWVLDVVNKQWNITVVDRNGNILEQSTQAAVITTDRKGNVTAN